MIYDIITPGLIENILFLSKEGLNSTEIAAKIQLETNEFKKLLSAWNREMADIRVNKSFEVPWDT